MTDVELFQLRASPSKAAQTGQGPHWPLYRLRVRVRKRQFLELPVAGVPQVLADRAEVLAPVSIQELHNTAGYGVGGEGGEGQGTAGGAGCGVHGCAGRNGPEVRLERARGLGRWRRNS
jgi:hypothetical protein